MTSPPHPSTPPPTTHLLLDFDSTLTTHSTLPVIASLSTYPSPHPHPSLSTLSASYLSDSEHHARNYIPTSHDRTTPTQELLYQSSLHSVERRSIHRLEASGIFTGVDRARVREVARSAIERGDVILRKGWHHLLFSQNPQKRLNVKVSIISVAWSRLFIRACLAAASAAAAGHEWIGRDVDAEYDEEAEYKIYANELAFETNAHTHSGDLDRFFSPEDRGIWTSQDKLDVMHHITATGRSGSDTTVVNKAPKTQIIYIGDSPTDLACLLAADVGICMRDRSGLSGEQVELKETLARIGVRCEDFGRWGGWGGGIDVVEEVHEGGGEQKTLWWISDFEEVVQSGILGSR